ncbi:MAG TPA: T9SS type A sorting domain-containing protein, partial [Bacteroidia bacterium]
LDSLLTGQTYFVQFHLSLADSMRYAIENIGALFTDTLFDPFPAPSYAWQTGIPQIENNQGNMLYDKLNWITISDSFTAIGGEKYMTIGNFKNDAQTIRQNLGGTIPNTQGAFYYIDDVYVGVTPPLSINENKKEEDFVKLYPNPSDGNMILECKLASNETGEMIIYTLTGNIMKRVAVNSGSKTLDVSELKAGMYLYEVRINEKAVEKNKLTIIK